MGRMDFNRYGQGATVASPNIETKKPSNGGRLDFGRYKTSIGPVSGGPVAPTRQPIQYKYEQPKANVIGEIPGAIGKVGKGIANFFTGNTQKLIDTTGKLTGEALAYHTDANVRKQVTGGNNPEMAKLLEQLITRYKAKSNDDPTKGKIFNEIVRVNKQMGATARNIKEILPQQGSYETTGEGIKDIAGKTLGSALELGMFSKGAKLAQAGLKGVGTKGTKPLSKWMMAKQGAKTGAGYGAGFGASSGLQEDKSLGGIAGEAALGGIVGAGAGSILSPILGKLGAKLGKSAQKKATQARTDALKAIKTPKTGKVTTLPPKTQTGAIEIKAPRVESIETKTTPLQEFIKPEVKKTTQIQDDIAKVTKGGGKLKERGFITTLKNSKLSQGAKDIISGSYVPKSNKSLINDARLLIKEDVAAAERLALNPRNPVDIKVGEQLSAHYDSIGNIQKVKLIGEAGAKAGTEGGQFIQAFSNYDPTTPSGAIRKAQSVIAKHNKLGKKQINITDTQVKGIYDAAAKVQEMPMGRDRSIASQKLMRIVDDLIPSTFGEKAITVWKAGLLTSLRTHERNILGNTMMAGSEIIKDLPAVGVDLLMKLRTKQRSMSTTLRGLAGGGKKGFQAAVDVIKTGYDPEKSIEKFDIKHITWGKGKIQQSLKGFTEAVFRTLGAEDKVFLHSIYGRSLYDQAGAAAINAGKRGNKAFIENLVKNPTDDMTTNAIKDSVYATFHDETMGSKVAASIKKALNKFEATKALGEILMPFTSVPASILGKMINYSPVGLLQGIRKAGTVIAKNVPALQRQAAQEIGRGVIGSGIFGLGVYLTKIGLMTGNSKDEKERRQRELEGIPDNSVMVNGKWRSIQSVGPQTLIALAGSKAQQELFSEDGGGVVAFGSEVGKDFLGQSFLANVQGLLQAISDPDRYAESYKKSLLTSAVPNIVKDTAKSLAPNQVQTNSVLEAFMAATPGLRNKLTPRRDPLGNIIPNEGPRIFGVNVGSFLDLFNSSTPRTSPVIAEIGRLNMAGIDYVPSNLASKQTLYGQSVQLSPKGLDDLEKASSGELQSELNTLINSQAYQSMEDEDKADEIQKKVTAIRRKYKKELAPMLVAGGMESSFEESDDGVKGVRNVFKLVGRYAQGMIKDPENALKAMFTEEHLRKIVGNAVILERKDLLALLDQGDKNTHVDHIVPLSLGGTNDSSNLRIVPAEENILKSKYERELLNLLKSGAITKKVAERRIMDWLESRPNQYPHL